MHLTRTPLSFFVQVKEIIESNNQSYVMLCGDLNLVIDPSIDCDQYKHINNPKSRETIFEIMDSFNLRHFSSIPSISKKIFMEEKTPFLPGQT